MHESRSHTALPSTVTQRPPPPATRIMAQLGKPVKGRTRDKKKKAGKSGDEEKVLQDKLRRMQEADYRKRLTMQVRTELKVRMALAPDCHHAAPHLQSMQARLAAEQKNSRVNSMRIQNQWRKIMRLAKVRACAAPRTCPRADAPTRQCSCQLLNVCVCTAATRWLRRSRRCAKRSRSCRKTTSEMSTGRMPSSRCWTVTCRRRKNSIRWRFAATYGILTSSFSCRCCRLAPPHVRRTLTVAAAGGRQDERLLALENEFERDLATLEDEFQSEKQQIKRQVRPIVCPADHSVLSGSRVRARAPLRDSIPVTERSSWT